MIKIIKYIPQGSFINLLQPISNIVLKNNILHSKPNFMNQYFFHEEIKIDDSVYYLNKTLEFNPIDLEFKQIITLNTSILTMKENTRISIYEDIDIIIDNSKNIGYNYKLNIFGEHNSLLRPQLFNYKLANINSTTVLNLENKFQDYLTDKLLNKIKKQIQSQ